MSRSFADIRQDIDFCIGNRDAGGLQRIREELIQRKQAIAAQLSDDRQLMLSERSTLILDGVDPKTAQIRASTMTDFEWRAAAGAALRGVEGLLQRIKLPLKALNVEIDGERRPLVLAFRGSAEEVAEAIAETGHKISAMVAYDGAVIVSTMPVLK